VAQPFEIEFTQSALNDLRLQEVSTMKTVDLTSEAPTVDQLVKLAASENVILRTAEAREFLLAELEGLDEEVEAICRNQELMQFLDERSQEQRRYSLTQVREILEREYEAAGDDDHQSRT
jgi:hypothetical protein